MSGETQPQLSVADIASYLTMTGWRPAPERRRTASLWRTPGGHEVLLPARDGMGDGELRVREILTVLAGTEKRPAREIAEEIGAPLTDIQTYTLSSDGLPTLPAGVRAVNGVRQLLDSAGRAYLEGPHVMFRGRAPLAVQALIASSRFGAGTLGGSAFRVHVPVQGPVGGDPLARSVMVQLHDAVRSAGAAADEAGRTGDLTRFDDAITAGVSANLCAAMSDLSGQDHEQPFEIDFTWARGLPSHLPAARVRVGAGSGAVLAAGARHLRGLSFSGEAGVTGVIEDLHDDAGRSDRRRIKVRGDVAGTRGVASRRALWVRLDSASAYDVALAAHRDGRLVRAEGTLTVVNNRLELLTPGTGFGLFPSNSPPTDSRTSDPRPGPDPGHPQE